jgi:hypothetical protein
MSHGKRTGRRLIYLERIWQNDNMEASKARLLLPGLVIGMG